MCPIPVSEISSRLVNNHGDFHTLNIIRTPDKKLMSIDFEFAGVTSAIHDIAYAFNTFIKDADKKRKFIKTYL